MPQGQHMEKFNFISSMTEHLAWPLTCLVVLLVIRKQLIALFSRLGSIKHGDTEFQFSKGSEALIKKEATSPEVKEKIRHQQIVTTQNGKLVITRSIQTEFLFNVRELASVLVTITLRLLSQSHFQMKPPVFSLLRASSFLLVN
jgi:hypothetical protein